MAERLLTINMRRYLVAQHRGKRVRKAAGYVRERVAHYTKTAVEGVTISRELNNSIVKRYSKSMEPLRLRVSVDKGAAKVDLFKEAAPQPHPKKEAAPQKPRADSKPAAPAKQAK